MRAEKYPAAHFGRSASYADTSKVSQPTAAAPLPPLSTIAPPKAAEGGGSSAYKGAVKQALDVAAALTTAGNNLPSVEQWRRFRAAASGALPAPTQRERAATRARMAATGYVPPPTRGGRDGERLTAMQVAVREATNAARKAAKTITWTAIEWRKTNAPEWRGGAAGEQDGDDDDDVDDDDGDDRSQPVPELSLIHI